MKLLFVLWVLLTVPLLTICQSENPPSISMDTVVKRAPEGDIQFQGEVTVKELKPSGESPFAYTIMVSLEYIEADGDFPLLPQSFSRQRGFVYGNNDGQGTLDHNSSKNRIKCLIAPLEKPVSQITLPLDEICPIPESTTQYRIVATLIKQHKEKMETHFFHSIYGPVKLTESKGEKTGAIDNKSKVKTSGNQQPKSSGSARSINLKFVLMVTISFFIVLVVVLVFKSSPNKRR
jgi:hypothetical protein